MDAFAKLQAQLQQIQHQATKQQQLEAAARATAEAQAAEAAAAAAAANDQLRQQQQLQLQQQQQAAAAAAAAEEAARKVQLQQTATYAPEWWAEFLAEEARVTTTNPSIADLPAIYPQPQQDCLQALDVAWRVLETVQLQHDRLLSFSEVGLSAAQCAELLGGVWTKMYGQHRVPAVMPRILTSFLFRALRQLGRSSPADRRKTNRLPTELQN